MLPLALTIYFILQLVAASADLRHWRISDSASIFLGELISIGNIGMLYEVLYTCIRLPMVLLATVNASLPIHDPLHSI
jgi:hypothetical protein